MFSNIKVILFDLYGTLLVFDDFDHANNEWENTFYDVITNKNNINRSAVQAICKNILESKIEKDFSGGLTTYETKILKEFTKHSIDLSIDEIKHLADASLEKWQNYIRPADDAVSVLKKLSTKYKIGLITNFDHARHSRKVLASTGLEKCFHRVWISDEEGCQKPELEIFMKAVKHFGVKPQEIIYVGDNIVDDVKGSYVAGMVPVLIDRKQKSNMNHNSYMKSQFPTMKNTTVINSLSELLNI